MTEIEKCVCGGEPVWEADWLSCRECGRESPPGRAAIASWNHDMRGLRLLRELGAELFHSLSFLSYDEDKQSEDAAHELALRISAWAEEGDRE